MPKRTGELGLLVAGENAFYRTVLNVVGIEDSELYGIADTVVGTEGSALGVHPLSVDISLDGILGEVEVDIDELIADHIHVALEDNGRLVLHAASWPACG